LPEFRSFIERRVRPPTAAEARRQRDLEEAGISDVYISVESAPQSFWEAVLQATHWSVVAETNFSRGVGRDWWNELRWQEGWPPLDAGGLAKAYAKLIRDGVLPFPPGRVDVYIRLSAVEHLLDASASASDNFGDLVNEAAERFHVGIRLEGNRFVDVTSKAVHQEVVRPALQLLGGIKFAPVNELYRKGFDRLLAGDPAGAITASASAVEEMLRIGGCGGSTLQPLARSARAKGWITPGVEQSIIKLDAYRGDSDAHNVGTDEKELARLVLHIAASLLLYLGRTLPNVATDA
jgi:hypothetical protein